MSSSVPISLLSGDICEVGYDVYATGKNKELVWFRGVVSHVADCTICIKFDAMHGFDKSTVTFVTRNGNLLDDNGLVYPFKVVQSPGANDVTNVTEIFHCSGNTNRDDISILRILHVMSQRLNRVLNDVRPSLRKFGVQNHPLVQQYYIDVTADCSLYELSILFNYFNDRGIIYESKPSVSDITRSFVDEVTICFDSVLPVASMFNMSANSLSELRMHMKDCKRKPWCRIMGTLYFNDLNENDPLIICVAGNYNVWNSSLTYVSQQNTVQRNNQFVSSLKIVNNKQEYVTKLQHLRKFEKLNFFSMTWKSDSTSAICNVDSTRKLIYGLLNLRIPYVILREHHFIKQIKHLFKIEDEASDYD